MSPASQGITSTTRWALAFGCALSVGNLYYLQPLLAEVARDFHVSESQAGVAATLSQVGYALGMLTIVPLGDILERRSLILRTLIATSLVALAMAFAPSYRLLLVAAFALGVATCTPQLIVPFAATLAKPEERGRTVGFVMSGLLLGILLARTVSGFVGEYLGWRAVYLMASLIGVGLTFVMRHLLPLNRSANTGFRYGGLMRSLVQLFREEPVLRESAVYGACLFGAFSAFWTTLSFFIAKTPLNLGADVVGLFGLVGAAGALAAPVAGRLADRDGPRRTILVGILVTLASFGVMLERSLVALVIGVLLMDVGVQATQISNQSRIYARRPEARNRMNTVYMTLYFVGGSVGSALGNWAWSKAAWPGVCAVGMGFSAIALMNYALTARRTTPI